MNATMYPVPATVHVHNVGPVPVTVTIEMQDGALGEYELEHVEGETEKQATYRGPCPGCYSRLRSNGEPSSDALKLAERIALPIERVDEKGRAGARFVTLPNRLRETTETRIECDEYTVHAGCFYGSVVRDGWVRARALNDWGQWLR